MAIKSYKPTTPARRNMTVSAFEGIDKKAKPERSLTETLKKNAGRNSYGRITVRHRGGGNKRKYRIIDFKRDKMDMPATVLRLEYDPNRSANIALVQYEDGEKRYILAPVGLQAGDQVLSSAQTPISSPATACLIANIPAGHHHPQHRALPRQGRPAGPLRRHRRTADGQGGRARPRSVCPPARCAIVRLNCKAYHRPGWQHRSREHLTSVRPAGSATWAGDPPSAAPS